MANAALLTRRLMRKYGIPIENVLRHYDVVSKRCPAMWVDDENAWFAFKRQVMEVMEMTKEELLSLKGTGDHPSDWALQAAQWGQGERHFYRRQRGQLRLAAAGHARGRGEAAVRIRSGT